MLKFKPNSAKNHNKFGSSKDSSSPTIAWVSTDELNGKFDQDKSSKFSKLRLGNKKNSKKNVKMINGEPFSELHLIKDAFSSILPLSVGNGLDRISSGNDLKKSKKTFVSHTDIKQDSINMDLPDIQSSLCLKHSKNCNSAIITVISSDESLDGGNLEIRPVKKTKEKTKEKKSKLQVEISEVKYFKDDANDSKLSKGGNDFPRTALSYNPDINEDKIQDDFLNLYQLINILSHPVYKTKTIVIDLRNYNQYQSGTIFSATHFSEFQNKSCQFSIRKVQDCNYSSVVLFFGDNELDRADLTFEGHLKIFKIKCDSEFQKRTDLLFSQCFSEKMPKMIPCFTCFEFGSILLSENFDWSLQWLSRLDVDTIVTDRGSKVGQRVSEVPGNRGRTIISITANDVSGADYSDKNISESKPMAMLYQLSSGFEENRRIFLLFEDPDHLPFSLLALILMYKNHWSLADSISCIKYIRCQKFNLKNTYLNILKNFEKLFFGKRLNSGGHKSQLTKEFALDL